MRDSGYRRNDGRIGLIQLRLAYGCFGGLLGGPGHRAREDRIVIGFAADVLFIQQSPEARFFPHCLIDLGFDLG